MKPTRNIVKPNTGLWKPKGSVWFKKNDDSKLGDWDVEKAQKELEELNNMRLELEWKQLLMERRIK